MIAGLILSFVCVCPVPNLEIMKEEINAWEQERNQQKATVNGRFTNQDARVKLKRLYPQVDLS